MFRPFRPTFETLEKREVFSAGHLDFVDRSEDFVGPSFPHFSVTPQDSVLIATTYGRGVVATDINHDGRPDLAVNSPRDAASGLPSGMPERQLAGVYVKEMSFKSQIQSSVGGKDSFADHDAVFEQIGLPADLQRPGNDPDQIIAILIGLLESRSNGIAVDPKNRDAVFQRDSVAGVVSNTKIVASVIDTGVDLTHIDLSRNIWINQGEIPHAVRA